MGKLNWTPWMADEKTSREIREMLEGSVGCSGLSETCYIWTPAADVLEGPNGMTIHVDLPGTSLDDVTVELRGKDLWVYGNRSVFKHLGQEVYHALERNHGPFARRFTLPAMLDPGKINASMKNGVLTVKIGKKKHSRRSIIVD